MGILSTGTLSWCGPVSAVDYVYHVKAENTNGLSEPSILRTAAGKAVIVAPDGASTLEIPADVAQDLIGAESVNSVGVLAPSPLLSYRIDVDSRSQDLGGRVFKSLEFKAMKGGNQLDKDFSFKRLVVLRLAYQTQGTIVTPSAVGAAAVEPAAVVPTADQMSVYWYNGQRWVQLYGKADTFDKSMILETKWLGIYQIRSAERVSGFTFNSAGISNRFITPNGDGKNDVVVFTFDNPRDSTVSGKIYDLKGAEVAGMEPGPLANTLVWDGKSGGRPVPGGVYIYQIQAEGQVHNGTVVVIN